MDDDITLKRCPFCGGKAEILKMASFGKELFTVSCCTGGCMANISWVVGKTTAIAAWNRRTESEGTSSRADYIAYCESKDRSEESGNE